MSPVRYAAHHVRDAHLYSGWLLGGGWLHGCVANSRLSISVFHSAVDPYIINTPFGWNSGWCARSWACGGQSVSPACGIDDTGGVAYPSRAAALTGKDNIKSMKLPMGQTIRAWNTLLFMLSPEGEGFP